MTKVIIGVMGPGEGATPEQNELAYELGHAIAAEGWITLTGGREFGVMQNALKGASDNGGLTIGILPGETPAGTSKYAHIKIVTGIGNARNNINALSSHVVVVVGMTPGTASEVSLAMKANKKIIFLKQDTTTIDFFRKIGTYKVISVDTIAEVIDHIYDFISMRQIV